MNYIILIIIGIAWIVAGRYLAIRKMCRVAKTPVCVRNERSRKKAEGKEMIMEFLYKNEKIQNNDVEKLLDVSDSTAERYLDELEEEDKIVQHGEIGKGVFYTLK